MDFQQEAYAKGAAAYDERIRKLFPFYETIHPAINAILRGLLRQESELLIIATNTRTTTTMVLHFVPDDGGKLKFLRAIAAHLKSGAPLVLMDACNDLSVPKSRLLLDAWKHQQNLAGVKWEQVENDMNRRMQTIHLVSSNRTEQLLTEAGFFRIQRFFQIFMLGGWIAFKG